MNRVVQILMYRDDVTKDEANEIIEDVREELFYAIESNDFSLAEDIMYGELGLEMDYIFDIIF